MKKTTYEMWNIFKALLDKFTEQFIPMRIIRKTKKVKPEWKNGEIKRLIRETRKAYQIQQKEINRDLSSFCMPRKVKLGKVRDYVK